MRRVIKVLSGLSRYEPNNPSALTPNCILQPSIVGGKVLRRLLERTIVSRIPFTSRSEGRL